MKEYKEFIINSRRTENERYIIYKLWEKIVKKDDPL